MICSNDPWAADGAVCLSPVVGAYLTILSGPEGDPMAVIVPSCSRHSALISSHLEEIAEADGIWVNACDIASASQTMREALGLDVHQHSLTLSA
jgi:hypothetical protein